EQEREQQRSHGRGDDARRRVAHHVEPRQPAHGLFQAHEEMEQHYSSSSRSAARTSSIFMPREPLMTIQSPGCVHSTARTAAAYFSSEMNTSSRAIPASRAPRTISRPSLPTPMSPSTPRATAWAPTSW